MWIQVRGYDVSVIIHLLYAHATKTQKRKYGSVAVLIPPSPRGFICLVGCMHPGAWWPKRPTGKNSRKNGVNWSPGLNNLSRW